MKGRRRKNLEGVPTFNLFGIPAEPPREASLEEKIDTITRSLDENFVSLNKLAGSIGQSFNQLKALTKDKKGMFLKIVKEKYPNMSQEQRKEYMMISKTQR